MGNVKKHGGIGTIVELVDAIKETKLYHFNPLMVNTKKRIMRKSIFVSLLSELDDVSFALTYLTNVFIVNQFRNARVKVRKAFTFAPIKLNLLKTSLELKKEYDYHTIKKLEIRRIEDLCMSIAYIITSQILEKFPDMKKIKIDFVRVKIVDRLDMKIEILTAYR